MASPPRRLRLAIDGSYGPRVGYAIDKLARVPGLDVEKVADPDSCEIAIATTPGWLRLEGSLDDQTMANLQRPESFVMTRVGERLVIIGSDEQGLMYGLLEITDLLEHDPSVTTRIEPVVRSPDTEIRGVFTFLHNRDCEDEWFHSTEHWSDYFDLLARSRFNSFNLVLGHQTNYLAPPFPFFVDVPTHPEVRVTDLTPDEQRRNLDSLRMITELAATRGLTFVLGIWEVIAWSSSSRGGHTQESMVSGLDWDNVTDYTYHAVRRLLDEVPGIRGVQLRVNGESGIPREHQTEFFAGTFFRALGERDGDVFLDLRGWLAEQATIEAARATGVPTRLSMKFWAEHLGAPYQAASQEPAYSYADFLRQPLAQPVTFQVWALGSHRHFIWGDPEYVRTFASTLGLGGASGFEISPPLAQKGFGNEPGAWRVLESQHEHYRWEWERYWSFFSLFGRLTYDRTTGSASWRRELESRFGSNAGAVEALYTTMSKVVSYVMTFNMSDPNMYIWPEADTGGILDFYLSVPPSDPARFEGIEEAAVRIISGRRTARVTPLESAETLERMGRSCIDAITELGDTNEMDLGSELRATLVDGTALGHLALYHAEKTRAALALAIYYETGDISSLLTARDRLRAARPHWEALADVTDGFYSKGQVTGPVDAGHWKDKALLIQEDEERLEERIELHRLYGGGTIGGATAAFDMGGAPAPAYSYTRFPVHQNMVERGFVGVDESVVWGNPLTSSYGWDSVDGSIRSIAAPLARLSDRHLDSIYRDTMSDPGHDRLVPFTETLFRNYVAGEGTARFNVAVPAGTYETIIVFRDRSQDPQEHGPFSISVNGDLVKEDLRVSPEEPREIKVTQELARGLLSIDFAAQPGSDWFCSAVIVRPMSPHIVHIPPREVAPGSPVTLSAAVTSVSDVESVTLEILDGEEVSAIPTSSPDDGVYEAELPRCLIVAGRQIDYRFRVDDEHGAITWLPAPDADQSDPHLSIRARTPSAEPELIHDGIREAISGHDVVIEVKASTSGIAKAVLNYRYVNQYYSWNRIAMAIEGEWLRAAIPASYVVPEWDLMYFIEVFTDDGKGTIVPGGRNLYEVPYWVTHVSG